MKIMLILTASLFCSVYLCSAHVCMLSPPQRGSMNGINNVGTKDCFLFNKPCGGRLPSKNPIILRAGYNFTVTIQKNLNHHPKSSPGHFSINWLDMNVSPMTTIQLMKIPDLGEPSLTLYSRTITIPKTSKSGTSYVLQTQYVTNNPKSKPVYYQCSDVMII